MNNNNVIIETNMVEMGFPFPEGNRRFQRKCRVLEEKLLAGAELSDVFDEESQHQYYPEDSDIKYMEDRSNCRKK